MHKNADQWQRILDFVVAGIRNTDNSLTDLARQTGINLSWFHRMRYRNDVKDPGFTKIGRVFMALKGSAPRLPKEQK